MTRSNNKQTAHARARSHPGFFTFESLMAISIVGFFIIPLIGIQLSMRGRIAAASHTLERLFFMEQFLHQARREQITTHQENNRAFTFTTTKTDPATDLLYTLESVPGTSTLASIPGLIYEKITATIPAGSQKATVTSSTTPNHLTSSPQKPFTLISFLYRPEPEKEQDIA